MMREKRKKDRERDGTFEREKGGGERGVFQPWATLLVENFTESTRVREVHIRLIKKSFGTGSIVKRLP